jgi:hypothetical protein
VSSAGWKDSAARTLFSPKRSLGEVALLYLRVHQVAAQAERGLPARDELDRVLGIDGVGIGVEARGGGRGVLVVRAGTRADWPVVPPRLRSAVAEGVLLQVFDAGEELRASCRRR